MDFSEKPIRENPRTKANLLSQLLFAWIFPLFWEGARHGLNKNDLRKCLLKDKSKLLGDELQK